MKKIHYKFQRIPQLRLFDLKAQKKNVNFKKFMDLPLTFEQTIAQGISNQQSSNSTIKSHDNFIIRQNKPKISTKNLHRLATHKTSQNSLELCQSSHTLGNIISKCDRLKSKLLTNKKITRFEKDANKCYDYLNQLSNFNFQKYQHY